MVPNSKNGSSTSLDREKQEFESRKTGVKGLIDDGITNIPRIFKLPPQYLPSSKPHNKNILFQPPTIDLQLLNTPKRHETVKRAAQALQEWSLFNIVNHGIPLSIMNNILESTRQSHELPKEDKMALYTPDATKGVRFYTTSIQGMEAVYAYVDQILKLRDTLTELLSETLGVASAADLEKIGFMDGLRLGANYYPACPEPDLTMGLINHTDPYFINVLLQDKTGGLQICHHDEWVDLVPQEGVLTVFVADMLQIISNDTFKSLKHRVLAQKDGPRVSVSCAYQPSSGLDRKLGVMNKSVSESKPPLYKDIKISDYLKVHIEHGNQGHEALAAIREKI